MGIVANIATVQVKTVSSFVYNKPSSLNVIHISVIFFELIGSAA